MAGENRFQVGKEYLDRILAKLPEEQRGTVAAWAATTEAQETLGELGDGVLRQSDYTRLANETTKTKAETEAWHKSLEDWYAQNQPLVELGKKVQADPNFRPDPKPNGAPTPPASTGVTREELEKTLYERERGYVSFVDVAQELVLRHYQEFGERIRVRELIEDPKVKELGVEGVYNAKYGSRYQEKADKKRKDDIEAEVTKRLTEERKKFNSQPPYPISPTEFSPLDTLDTPADQKPKGDLVQRSVDEYNRLVSEKMTAGT